MSFRSRDDLASIPLFRHVPRRRRRAIARGAVRLEVPAGHVLFDEDSEGHELVAVLVGEGAVLTRTHRNASAIARTDATIVCIGASDFEDVEARWPAVAEEIRATVSQRQIAR